VFGRGGCGFFSVIHYILRLVSDWYRTMIQIASADASITSKYLGSVIRSPRLL